MDFEKHDNSFEGKIRTKEFISLLSLTQVRLYSYILSILGNFNDADDVIQETTLTMWQKFDQFQSGTDFLAWGVSVAYYKILEHRKKKKIPQLSDELIEQLNSRATDNLKDSNIYIEKLEYCMKKLNAGDYSLINQRYMSGYTVAELSKRFNVTIQAIYLRLSKIQGVLTRCIKRSVMEEAF
ncbi:MAG: sigma-70 family RNA polymerase sigma factor [Planctomycetaceae bacterium]|nr:sigma-70 family RNA polymerase sigma factor [Planctomycetaceae bacterium]